MSYYEDVLDAEDSKY